MSEGGEFQARKPEMTEKESLAIPRKKNTGMAVAVLLLAIGVLGLSSYIVLDKTVLSRDVANTPTSSENQVNCITAESTINQNSTDNTQISENVAVDSSEYFYIADWGIKIKKPSDNYFYYYHFMPDTGSAVKGNVAISAAPKDAQALPIWTDWFENGKAKGSFNIYRLQAYEDQIGASYIGEKEGYHYYLSTPQQCSYMNENLEDCKREESIVNELADSLKDINNYSKI